MNKLKRILAVCLSALMFGNVLVGCNSSPESTTSSVTSSKTADAEKNGKLSGDLELQIFAGGYGETFWNEAIEGFKKENPDVNIITNIGPKVNEQMKTRWISGDAPDVVYVDGPEMPQAMPQLIKDGKIMDLKPWFETAESPDGKLIRNNLIDGVLRETDGKVYQAPYIFNTWGMWYDEKLMKDNGLSIPTDFDSFVEAGEKLKSKGIPLLCYTGVYANYLLRGAVLPGVASEGGQQAIDDIMDLKEGAFKSDAFKHAVEKVKILADKGMIMDGCIALNHTESQMEWLKRKAAFIPNGLWLESEMKKDIPADFSMKYLPSVFQKKGNKMFILPDSFGLAVSANTKNPDAAKAFLQYLYKDSIVKRFVELSNTPSVFNVDTSSLNISEATKSVQKYLTDPNVKFVSKKRSDIIPEVETEIDNCLNSLVQKQITVDEVCERAEKAAQIAREDAE